MQVPARFGHLAPFDTELVRVGANHDGGYVVPRVSLASSHGLLSLGIASEWSFDSEFLKTRKGIRYVCCDRGSGFLVHSFAMLKSFKSRNSGSWRLGSLRTAIRFLALVPPLQFPRKRTFLRKWVKDEVKDPKRDVLIEEVLTLFSGLKEIFVKMDIEGGEYELLPKIASSESKSPGTFTGVSVEFHDIKAREAEFLKTIEIMTKSFKIVHLHVNNCVPLTSDFPNVIEITFAPCDIAGITQVARVPRQGLDFPNDETLPDIELVFGLESL